MTPYQVIFGKPHSYDFLRTFGCLCFASTPSHNRPKFAPRATSCVFIGYPQGKKGYKLLELSTRKILISRDVSFHESIFPFSSSSSTQHIFPHSSFSPDPFDGTVLPTSPPISPHSNPPSHPTEPIISTDASDLTDTPSPSIISSAPRRSTRTSKVPSYLNDYLCNSVVLTDLFSHFIDPVVPSTLHVSAFLLLINMYLNLFLTSVNQLASLRQLNTLVGNKP